MGHRAVPAILGLAALATASGCLRPLPGSQEAEAAGCIHDAQCKGDRICEQGVCLGAGRVHGVLPVTDQLYGEGEAPRTSCDDGSPQACYEAGMRSVFGVDGPEDLGQARAYFHRACRSGHVYACMNLGLLLEPKPGGATDPRKCRVFAVESYDRACDQGHAEACYNAGRLYEGLPVYTVPRDLERSRKLLRRACDLGHQEACRQDKD
jgi:hypothetical protein